jgi:hypothetical protein
MLASTMTLSDYFAGCRDQTRVLVEHSRCGQSLGTHRIGLMGDRVLLSRSGGVRIAYVGDYGHKPIPGQQLPSGMKGPLTAPGVSVDNFEDHLYARVWCPCLPKGHQEKLRPEKVGSLPVTFPEWKWGRPVELPVVTI